MAGSTGRGVTTFSAHKDSSVLCREVSLLAHPLPVPLKETISHPLERHKNLYSYSLGIGVVVVVFVTEYAFRSSDDLYFQPNFTFLNLHS